MDETGHVRQPIRRVASPVEAFAVPGAVCVRKMREVADSGRGGRAHIARVDVDEGRELLVGGCAVQRLADPSERAAVEVDPVVLNARTAVSTARKRMKRKQSADSYSRCRPCVAPGRQTRRRPPCDQHAPCQPDALDSSSRARLRLQVVVEPSRGADVADARVGLAVGQALLPAAHVVLLAATVSVGQSRGSASGELLLYSHPQGAREGTRRRRGRPTRG